jgi:putative aminopeptidase FrvX
MNQELMDMAVKAGIEFTNDPTETPMTTFAECWIEELEAFAALVRNNEAAKWIKGSKISIPTEVMEQQFSWYHKQGYEAGKKLIPAAIAAEREACAKVCDYAFKQSQIPFLQGDFTVEACAYAIRARGETK